MTNAFFDAIGIDSSARKALDAFSTRSGVELPMLRYYNNSNILPTGKHLESICSAAGLDPLELEVRMGHLSRATREAIAVNFKEVKHLIGTCDIRCEEINSVDSNLEPRFVSDLGVLYNADCIDVMAEMESDRVDLIFADPPFNLKKLYPSEIDDDLKEQSYLAWSEEWLSECIRILKPGGSLFLWNLPRWNPELSGYLNGRLTFRHWISVDLKYSLPIAGRLYPSHYGLLYYCKGPKPKTFHPDRLPMEVCPKCATDLRDYGGYKNKMNPSGVNLMDVWYDITPVRHSKYKKRQGANELSIRLLDRVIQMSSVPGDVIFDPFGGSGTTYAVAELKERNWIGAEVGPIDDIVRRLSDQRDERKYLDRSRADLNSLFPEDVKEMREKHGLWTDDSVRNQPRIRREETQA